MTELTYDFGTSPYVVEDDNEFMSYFLMGVIIIILIYLIYCISKKYRINGEDSVQRAVRKHFTNLHGEDYDDDAKAVIALGETIENPTAMDHYRIGITYLTNASAPHKAYKHFATALKQITAGEVSVRETPFILNRIDDVKDRFIDFPDIDELPLQQALFAHYNAVATMQSQLKKERLTTPLDTTPQAILLTRQDNKTDSQNVHDSAIHQELKEQFLHVISENAKIPNGQLRNYADVTNWLKIRYRDDDVRCTKVNKVIAVLNNNYPVGWLTNVNEQSIIVAVWQRAYDPGNALNFNEIREALGEAILDCIEGSICVCQTGRVSKIWQALAMLDKDPAIGVFKGKQQLRNEIYELAAKIIDDYVGKNGSASEDLKKDYIAGSQTEQVQEIIECMTADIEALRKNYKDLLPDEQLEHILEECKAIV